MVAPDWAVSVLTLFVDHHQRRCLTSGWPRQGRHSAQVLLGEAAQVVDALTSLHGAVADLEHCQALVLEWTTGHWRMYGSHVLVGTVRMVLDVMVVLRVPGICL